MGYQMYAASHEKWDPPHKKLSPRLIWVAEAALRKAWKIATSDKRPNASWRTADEDDLTLDLFEALKDTVWQNRMIPGFNKEIFSTINREPKVRNYNGERPDKMPDLLIEFKEIPPLQKNSWVDSGSGRSPMVWNRAVCRALKVLNP